MLPPFVSLIGPREVVVVNGTTILDNPKGNTGDLIAASKTRADGSVVISFGSEADLARVLTLLRDQDVAFASATSGWSPADVFDDLRHRGLINGHYEAISFRGPANAVIRTK